MSYMKMDPVKKMSWVAALRSKKYNQTTEHLKDEIGYCCLGVYCDISGLGKWEEDEEMGDIKYSTPLEADECVLPRPLDADIGDEAMNKLIEKNDNGESFAKIADWIEENL